MGSRFSRYAIIKQKKYKGIKYLLCAIDLFSKYVFVVTLKDKKGISITNAFKKNNKTI